MTFAFLGIFGFLLFFIYEINTVKWHNRVLNILFMLGCGFIGLSTSLTIIYNWKHHQVNYIYLVIVILFLVLLVYTLFFALPFSQTYVENQKNNKIYKEGVYALCRHPGVLWFIGFYVFLYAAFPSKSMLYVAIATCICNAIYIVIQDIWSFPMMFYDYEQYKKEAPFLIPNLHSIKKCFSTINNRGEKNE